MTDDRKTGANRRLAKVAVQCFADTFVQGSTFVLRMNISAKNPARTQSLETLNVIKLKSPIFF
jgi:hypothetical protein